VLPLALTPYALGSALTLPHTAKMLAPRMVIGRAEMCKPNYVQLNYKNRQNA